MIESKDQQFCNINLNLLFELAYECQVKVVGTFTQIFQHKKYIVQVFVQNQLAIRAHKRYSQFEALYQVLRMNFKNIDIGVGDFPSKFQLVNREETRRQYFERMLNKIIQIYLQRITSQTNRRLLSTIFVFLAGQSKPNKKQQKSTRVIDSIDTDSNEEEKKSQLQTSRAKSLDNMEQLAKKQYLYYKHTNDQEDINRLFNATQFLIKFQDEDEWKERYLKIQNSCLLVYRHKNDNHFKSKIQLFQAKIQYLTRDKNLFDNFCQKMELDNQPVYSSDRSIISLCHQYDYKKLLIKIKNGQRMDILQTREILQKATHKAVQAQIQGVFNPIGKLFIVFHKILFPTLNNKSNPIVFLRIRAGGLTYQSKRMTFQSNNALTIKQGFMIPISNTFANIFLQIMMLQNDGIIRHQSQQKCIGSYRISYADFISYPCGHGLQKIRIRPVSQIFDIQSLVQVSIMNYSDFSSLYADSYANQNDGQMLSGLKSTSDTDQLVITVDRVLRVIGNIALFITAFWRNVYLFKYPIMGYAFFMFLLIFINTASSGNYFSLIIIQIICALAYNNPYLKPIILENLNQYIFKYIHPSFKQPLCLSSNQVKFLKWTTNLVKIKQDFEMNPSGKLSKTQFAKDKTHQQWKFIVHNKQFIVKQQLPGLLQKLVLRMISAVINTIQKILNIFSWADSRRTRFIVGIFVFVALVAHSLIFRAIGTIFCIHRLVKAMNFYKQKHYNNNKKLAIYCLRYIVNKHFLNLLKNKQKITSISEIQIINILKQVIFPIRQEDKLKKLKTQIQRILGIYIDNQQLYNRQQKKNCVRLIHLVQIIQSCQARLKLQWISGKQGIQDDFQQLKSLTNQELVMDLWIQSLLINFFLNVPSQLYTTFRPIRKLDLIQVNQKQKICFKKLKI